MHVALSALRIARRRAGIACLFAACTAACAPAYAAELRILAPSALRPPLLELAQSFARAGGHRIGFVFASVGAVHKRIASAEKADMAIATLQGAEALVRLGPGVAGSRMPLVRSALALVLAAAAGRTSRQVGDPQALAAILRDARSLVLPDAAAGIPGGAHAIDLLEQLGLREEVRAKTRFVAGAREVAKLVAAGDAEVGLGPMSEVPASAELAVLGPLAEPRPAGIVFAALVVRGAREPDVARAFIAHLRTPQAAGVFRKHGYVYVE